MPYELQQKEHLRKRRKRLQNTNAAFMEVTSKKIDMQDQKILSVEEKIKNLLPDAGNNGDLLLKIEELRKKASRKK